MGAFLAYIFKSCLCIVAYYVLFKMFLSKETFHHFNRKALLSLMLLSFIIPLVGLTVMGLPDGDAETYQITWEGIQAQVLATDAPSNTILSSGLSWGIGIVIILYLAGVLYFLVRTLCSYLSLISLLHRGKREHLPEGSTLILTHQNVLPCSWLHYIVMNEKDYAENGQAILLHELGHIHQHHTIDLLLTEAAIILQWFNPAIWLMRKELQIIHEYEADEMVLDTGINPKTYQLLLIKKAAGNRLQPIVNGLHQSSIKKRITMMLKKKSNPWARAKYALALPVAFISVALFETPEASALTAELSEYKASDFLVTSATQSPNPTEALPTLSEANTLATAPDNNNDVYVQVEKQPEFPGGETALMEFLQKTMKYPEEAAKNKIEGRVVVSFVIEKDGSISNIEIMRSPHKLLSEEGIRVIKNMPKWEPGTQRGEKVRVKYVLPISFRLNKKDYTNNNSQP